jgi:hypothetical protein
MTNKPENDKPNMLNCIEHIVSMAKENGLDGTFFEKAKPHLEAMASSLKITEIQACLFSLILEHSGNKAVSIGELDSTIKCGRVQLLKYIDDFEALEKKRMIQPSRDWEPSSIRRRKNRSTFPSYTVPLDVIKAVKEGMPYRDKTCYNLPPEDFYAIANELFEMRSDGNFDFDTFTEELKILLTGNRNIAFVKSLKSSRFRLKDAILLLAFCCSYIEDDIEALSLSKLHPIFGARIIRSITVSFKSRNHPLIERGLVEAVSDMGVTDGETWRLTQKAHDTFLADMLLTERKYHNGKNMIFASDIKERLLLHPQNIKMRIFELTKLLREENFCDIKKRLAEMNMRTAFTCIFSGPPGTGKTETVYQIARETGRDIFLVDISETKSMWFGESEKRIKAVFDRYRGMIKGSVPVPILLFNEADAVLGKRQELGETRRGPAHTENAIQNIILQEMENLEGGILIATTNMKINLDKAFERRFLYKLEFEKPDVKTGALIWRNFLPELPEEDAITLASRFNFSGGQIDNIARKNTVSYLLSGRNTNIESLIKLCEEEPSEASGIRIGFGK